MNSNGKIDQGYVTQAVFEQGMEEQVANIIDVMNVVNSLKRALNTQAEVLGCHRYVLEKFVPQPLLEQAAKDYADLRKAVIEQERLGADGKSQAN
jgi:hypothetical protein